METINLKKLKKTQAAKPSCSPRRMKKWFGWKPWVPDIFLTTIKSIRTRFFRNSHRKGSIFTLIMWVLLWLLGFFGGDYVTGVGVCPVEEFFKFWLHRLRLSEVILKILLILDRRLIHLQRHEAHEFERKNCRVRRHQLLWRGYHGYIFVSMVT